MDKKVAERLDSIAEGEIQRSYRIRQLPADLQALLRDAGIDPPQRIRLSKMNPARRRKINEVVQRRYHADLQDREILSDSQVLELVKVRGEWNETKKARMDELQQQTTRDMARLWHAGLTPDSMSFRGTLAEKVKAFQDSIEGSDGLDAETKAQFARIFARWYRWRKDLDYTDEAVEQGRERYSVDADWAWMIDHAPTIGDGQVLSDIEELKDKQVDLDRLNEARFELAELQIKHARIFAGTVESRQSHAEEMAQLYYTCERLDATDVPLGPLTETFDALYEFPQAAITWLLYESMFFHNDIADEARDYLATFGFLKAERSTESATGRANATNGANTPSDASPVPQSSNSAGAPADTMASDSLALQPVTI